MFGLLDYLQNFSRSSQAERMGTMGILDPLENRYSSEEEKKKAEVARMEFERRRQLAQAQHEQTPGILEAIQGFARSSPQEKLQILKGGPTTQQVPGVDPPPPSEWTNQDVYKHIDRAIAAEQQRLVAERARATAATPQRRSYPIDAYGSTPEERIRTIQNLNAQESQGEAITEQSGPPMDMIQTAMNYGMPTYNPQEVEIFHSRPRYEFSPDLGPQQAHADANMAHAANDRARMEAIQKQVQAEQAAAAQQRPFTDYVNAAKAYEATGDHPVAQEVMQRAAAQYLEQQKLREQQQLQQQMLRQQMQMRRPTLPVTGRPLSLLEMIQYGQIA